MDGFEHLQDYYVVKRNGEWVGVPLEDMTDEELDQKAHHHEAMGNSLANHADELLRYQSLRS